LIVGVFLGFWIAYERVEEPPVELTYTVIRSCYHTEDLLTCLHENGLKVVFDD
jgi:hypothetical protein